MKSLRRLAPLVFIVVAACSDDPPFFFPSTDTGEPDTSDGDDTFPDGDAGERDVDPDAADDSGDTGESDTGEPDAGEPDAGEPDAGEPDTGEPDTGEPDTGEPDTGEPDTGEPDTGEPDTGEPDTAPLCEAGTQRCDGSDVVVCDEDGESESFVGPCEFGCDAGRCIDPCTDGRDYLGCMFWAADLDNIGPDASAAQFAVTISNASSDPVDVEIARGDGEVVRTLTIATDSVETVLLDRQDVDDSALTSNTYRISSGTPVTVHQFNPMNNADVSSNDASLLLPSTSVGTEYIVIGWPSIVADADLRAYVAIINPNPEPTEVTVTSPIATLPGPGVVALRAGVPQAFTLEEGQILSLITNDLSHSGLTGMEIVGTQPIVVFSGHECANVPSDNNFCDHLEQQLLPVDTWGTEFVGAKFQPRGTEPDVWRVVAAERSTMITTSPSIPGINGITLHRGEMREFVTTSDFVLSASGPVQLAQFMVGSAYPGALGGCDLVSADPITSGCAIPRTCEFESGIGDPAFLLNVPTAQFRNEYIVLTPERYEEDYLTLVSPAGTTITLDGRAITDPPTRLGAWEIRRISAADGPHRLAGDNEFGLYAYGYDCDVSYAYPGGLNLDSL